MATPLFDALVNKVRDWSNKKELATIPDSVLQDCLKYSADDCYRLLRIPPLEYTAEYTITASDLPASDPRITTMSIPSDLSEFIYIRTLNTQEPIMYNQIADSRTLLDAYAEKYSMYSWAWKGNLITLTPRLKVGDKVEIHYFRRLSPLDAVYSVVPENYISGFSNATQPFLSIKVGGIILWIVTVGSAKTAFVTEPEADAFIVINPTGVKTSEYFEGKEAPNWLRDGNERLLLWGALAHAGAYLFDDTMETRYRSKVSEHITQMNSEEKMRRARGGNVQINISGGGLI
jgi:hypothetical protein